MRISKWLIALLLILVFRGPTQASQSVSFGWTASVTPDVIGYKLYYGVSSGIYTNLLILGNVTNTSVSGLTQNTTYFFALTAYDALGLESVYSQEISYTVPTPTNPPTVVLTAPTNGASYVVPATINLAAGVTPNSHTIIQVKFYNGSTLLGQSSNAPYSLSWANVSAGTYSLSAQAVYDAGGSVTSSTVSVTVTNPVPIITLITPTNGASYVAPASVNFTANVSANGHIINQVQFYNGSTLLGQSSNAPYTFNCTNVSAGSYSLSAQAIYDAGNSLASSTVNIIVLGLPAPWLTLDIGTAGLFGSAFASNGIYTVAGAGNISGGADNFYFAYQSLTGDGEIKANITSTANTGTSARIGVMIREALTSGSKHVFVGISPDGSYFWQRRSNTGGNTWSGASGTGTLPNVWTRLVRSSNTFYAYTSADGLNWTQVGQRTITMATNIYIGLAVASGSLTMLNPSTFSNVGIVP